MELYQYRKIFSDNSTIGEFYIDGKRFGYGLEPVDRHLTHSMSLAEILKIKKAYPAGSAAIPPGRYQVIKYYSPKHKAFVPCLVGVPGFEFIEIHVGNYPKDTDGCLLLGNSVAVDMVQQSKAAIEVFYMRFFEALILDEKKVFITYSYSPPQIV